MVQCNNGSDNRGQDEKTTVTAPRAYHFFSKQAASPPARRRSVCGGKVLSQTQNSSARIYRDPRLG